MLSKMIRFPHPIVPVERVTVEATATTPLWQNKPHRWALLERMLQNLDNTAL